MIDYSNIVDDQRYADNDAYQSWIDANEEDLVCAYGDSIIDFPEEIYEGILDDDYPEAEERYIESLKIEDVPDDYIQGQYEVYLEDNYGK